MTDVKDGKLSDFRPQKDNANAHTERGLKLLGNAYSEVGYVAPMTATADGEIIDGSARLEVAFDQFPDDALIVRHDGQRPVIMVREDIVSADTPEAKKISYSANRVGELDLAWNPETILADLKSGVDLSGLFREDELKEILGELGKTPQEDPGAQVDKAAELQEKWGTSLGQIWELDEHRLICGDCTDKAVVEAAMRGERAVCICTDAPYGQNQKGVPNDDPGIHRDLIFKSVGELPINKAGSIIVCFQSPRNFINWIDAVREFEHKWERMLWLYKAAQMVYPWRGWLLTSEAILISSYGKFPHWNEIKPNAHDCYYLSENSGQLSEMGGAWHGSVKDLSIVTDLVNRTSFENDIIYDPFLGTGTTLIACQKIGRKCRGIEIDPGYCAVTLERWHTMIGKDPVLTNA